MKGNEQMLYQYMEGASKRFIIPVYQRNYDWKIEHCKRLFDDLITVSKKDKNAHFFGSIVSAQDEHSKMDEYLIIDGQQRLTTVSLMLLALHNALFGEIIKSDRQSLSREIMNKYLIDEFTEEDTKIKLKPVKDDSEAFVALMDEESEHIRASNITINYNYFYDRILKEEISANELYDAFRRLQIINIYLSSDDNPQLIFESLNSTGLDLSEGDKIRNFILMGLKPVSLQERYYNKYWHKIEKYTDYNVSAFVRDYLSIKTQSTPAFKKVYMSFKEFMSADPFETKEELMEDLLSYAKRYEILIKANSENGELNGLISRLNRFEATVTRPFLLEVLKHSETIDDSSSLFDLDDLLGIFETVESFIFRRQLSDIPTNALKNLFVRLNNEVIRFEDNNENYLEKLKYALLRKTTTGIYPDDRMFAEAISSKEVYLMQAKNKKYIMERLENFGTKEVKDVWGLIDEGTYTIEHIMPRTLNGSWKEDLGEEHELIHEKWLDRLANLTLTAYNSNYSNNSFDNKKNMENGFIESGLRMNQMIAKNDQWGLKELEERNWKLIEQGLKIWPMIETEYKPPEKVMDSITLADEESMKGRSISKISLLGVEQTVDSWVDAFMKIIAVLYDKNPKIILKLATEKNEKDLSIYVEDAQEENSSYSKLDEGIYLWVNTSTDTKLNILKRFFSLYELEEEDLIIYLQDKEPSVGINSNGQIRKEFWTLALPIISDKTNRFVNRTSNTSSWKTTPTEYPSIHIGLVANLNSIRTELYLGSNDKQENEDLYHFIEEQKELIESESKEKYLWSNNPDNRTSKICIEHEDVGISNRNEWESCINLFIKDFKTIEKQLVPIVDEYFDSIG